MGIASFDGNRVSKEFLLDTPECVRISGVDIKELDILSTDNTDLFVNLKKVGLEHLIGQSHEKILHEIVDRFEDNIAPFLLKVLFETLFSFILNQVSVIFHHLTVYIQ